MYSSIIIFVSYTIFALVGAVILYLLSRIVLVVVEYLWTFIRYTEPERTIIRKINALGEMIKFTYASVETGTCIEGSTFKMRNASNYLRITVTHNDPDGTIIEYRKYLNSASHVLMNVKNTAMTNLINELKSCIATVDNPYILDIFESQSTKYEQFYIIRHSERIWVLQNISTIKLMNR